MRPGTGGEELRARGDSGRPGGCEQSALRRRSERGGGAQAGLWGLSEGGLRSPWGRRRVGRAHLGMGWAQGPSSRQRGREWPQGVLQAFFLFKILFMFYFWLLLGLRCCTRAFLWLLLFVAVRRLLTAVASLVGSTGSRRAGFSSCGSRA